MLIYLLCVLLGATLGLLVGALGAAAGRADAIEQDRAYRDQMELFMADEWELRAAAERMEWQA